MIRCERCNEVLYDEFGRHYGADLHHIIPRCIDGTDLDGRIWLCGSCHDELHNIYFKYMLRKINLLEIDQSKDIWTIFKEIYNGYSEKEQEIIKNDFKTLAIEFCNGN